MYNRQDLQESTSVRALERQLWERDIWSDIWSDPTATGTRQCDKPFAQAKLILFPALHQLFLFPPSVRGSQVLMAMAVPPRWFSQETEWIQMKKKTLPLHIRENQGGVTFVTDKVIMLLYSPWFGDSKWSLHPEDRQALVRLSNHSPFPGQLFELMSMLELAWGAVVRTHNIPSIIVSISHQPLTHSFLWLGYSWCPISIHPAGSVLFHFSGLIRIIKSSLFQTRATDH